jgi:hypothetical protein
MGFRARAVSPRHCGILMALEVEGRNALEVNLRIQERTGGF